MPTDESPSSILNRAANQIATVGVARLTREELSVAVSILGPRASIKDVEISLSDRLVRGIYYWGVDSNKCVTFREGEPPRMSGKKKASEHMGDALPYLGATPPPKHPWRKRRPDSADGAPA